MASFADFGAPERPDAAPGSKPNLRSDDAPDPTDRGRCGNLERETGLEPATLSLGTDEEPEEPPILALS